MAKGPLRTDVKVRAALNAVIGACLKGDSLLVIGARIVAFQDACDRYIGVQSIEVWRREAVNWVAHRISQEVAMALQESSEKPANDE